MDPQEYENLDRVERDHWYYAGKRAIAEHWLEATGLQDGAGQLLADCGAGTGMFALQMASKCRVIAIDDYEESWRILERRLPAGSALRGSCENLPLDSESCDFVTALDVLEHIEDDYAAIRELWRVLKPGGSIVITVPALMSLWSDWDVSLRHFRRYDRDSLLALAASVGPEVVVCNYMNFFAFPAVWAMRRLRGSGVGNNGGRAEDKIPPMRINAILRALFVWSSCQRRLRWPFGVGLLCVLRKRM